MPDIRELWMVVRADTHGVTYLMKADLDRETAQAYLQSILDSHSKPHHQDYELYNYTPETRAQRMQELRLVPGSG